MKYNNIKQISVLEYLVLAIPSLGLLVSTYLKWLPLTYTEVLGFITGIACVWLCVKENVWNWPIGNLNSVFFLILFLRERLFADAGLQIIYITLGFLGWYWWLRGGKGKTELPVSRIDIKTATVLALLGIFGTFGMMMYLRTINDSAPFLDALTTVLSLIAQYLLTKKKIENWYVWIIADAIYLYLYFSKGLYLTTVVYVAFFTMCFSGLSEWKKSLTAVSK